MEKIKIVWTKTALKNLESALDYVNKENPEISKNIIDLVLKSLEILKSHPNIGRHGRVKNTQELVIAKYPFIIPYRVTKKQIEILAFLHTGRRWPKKF